MRARACIYVRAKSGGKGRREGEEEKGNKEKRRRRGKERRVKGGVEGTGRKEKVKDDIC